MKAVITGENNERVGVNILDNNGAEHGIEMEFDGEIKHHQCEEYADRASQRTSEENEYNNQARRFARYYVFVKRGYDTVDHADNPTYIDTVRRAIGNLPDAEFERYFGALHKQLRSHHENVERPIDLPADVRSPDAVVYEQDVYLGIDLDDDQIADRVHELAHAHGLNVENHSDVQPVSELSESDIDRWLAVGDDLSTIVERESLEPTLTISAVSGIHVGYPDARGRHQVQRAADPMNRQADTRLELLPYAPVDLEELRDHLDYHLRCQTRDCFVKMGLVPPREYQILGFGKFRDARRYDHFEIYPELHKQDGTHTFSFLI